MTPEEIASRISDYTITFEEFLKIDAGEMSRYLYYRIPVSQNFINQRNSTYDEYVATVLALDPNYVFPVAPIVPVVEFTWRETPTVDVTSLVLPIQVDKPLREVTIDNGAPIDNYTYDVETRVLQLEILAGQKLKVLY